MSATSDFLKLRSSKTPKVGEWNINYKDALAKAKKEGKFIVTCWSNGEHCSYCISAERCMADKVFTDWIKKQDAYFVFQYSGDKDKGKTLHDWIYVGTGIKQYPGYRVSLYDSNGKLVFDKAVTGNTLRDNKARTDGAKAMVANLDKMFANKPADETEPTPAPAPETAYKVRLNEKLTVKKVNSILDAIDKNDGYCPCQPKGPGTKCHCEDFLKEKKIGEPCICNIYVKMEKK